jgi:sporulation protein YlmC with PRC-barrel domain
MPGLRSLEGFEVLDANGTVLGRVTRVLCHMDEPRVIGIEVQPPNVAMVVSRRPRYFAIAGVRIEGDHLEVDDVKAWSGQKAAKALGIEWEKSVIWVGMPVLTESGTQLGYLRDASFEMPGGRVLEIALSEGLTSDAAIGTRVLAGDLAVGFDGAAVRVADGATGAQFSGGLAAKAGTGAAVAKVVVGDAAKRATELGGTAVKAAAKSKAARGAWSVLRQTGKAFKDAMKDEDTSPPRP